MDDKARQALISELRRDAEYDCMKSWMPPEAKRHVCSRAADEIESLQSQLKECRDKLGERDAAIEQIQEYNAMIPLHTTDSHVLHYVEQVGAWCKSILSPNKQED